MKIITISREFGSGGRELGKRLADALGIPCYDKQILDMVAERKQLDPQYVESQSEKDLRTFYPTTIARGFAMPNHAILQTAQIMASEQEIIRKLSEKEDCIIVGRAADILLANKNPFRIFVCANEASKITRCRARAEGNEPLSDKEILRKCREIDKRRASYRKFFTDQKWGNASEYELCINTSGKEIKTLIPSVAAYIENWFTKN